MKIGPKSRRNSSKLIRIVYSIRVKITLKTSLSIRMKIRQQSKFLILLFGLVFILILYTLVFSLMSNLILYILVFGLFFIAILDH